MLLLQTLVEVDCNFQEKLENHYPRTQDSPKGPSCNVMVYIVLSSAFLGLV